MEIETEAEADTAAVDRYADGWCGCGRGQVVLWPLLSLAGSGATALPEAANTAAPNLNGLVQVSSDKIVDTPPVLRIPHHSVTESRRQETGRQPTRHRSPSHSAVARIARFSAIWHRPNGDTVLTGAMVFHQPDVVVCRVLAAARQRGLGARARRHVRALRVLFWVVWARLAVGKLSCRAHALVPSCPHLMLSCSHFPSHSDTLIL
jgi:hypothetical protein